MARRSRAREVALQLLFQQDQNKRPMPLAAREQFARDRLREVDLVSFCLVLFDGVSTHQPQIDELISATAENWRLHRMLPADRNVLRLGTFELLYEPDPSPLAVILDEAIELARRYGTEESPKFVNGILDKIAKGRATSHAVTTPPSPEPDPTPTP